MANNVEIVLDIIRKQKERMRFKTPQILSLLPIDIFYTFQKYQEKDTHLNLDFILSF